ncbi:PREDICTED: uncharacterized protein C16orf59 homolog [Elephantulus edwardii]|uniref:uncharacterized protein C16orf59 homolog n=1 Tax=Elephantulus edwardii TaxID=28737 RepID=UPI0003F0E3F9|nr:PREDICTED: uncharacterized protein C16orf59 homolog [Elephantulus edwardii]
MLPADCSRRLLTELQGALDSVAKRQQQLDRSLRVCRRLLGTWKPAGAPAPEPTSGPARTEKDPSPANAPCPRDLKELELLTQALEKAVRVRKGVSKTGKGDSEPSLKPRTSTTLLAAPSSVPSRASEIKAPRGISQPKVKTLGHSERRRLSPGEKTSLGTGAPARYLSREDQQVTPSAAPPKAEAFTLKDKGTLLRLPVALQKAAAQNSRLWAQIDSTQTGDVENAAARARFLQKMKAAVSFWGVQGSFSSKPGGESPGLLLQSSRPMAKHNGASDIEAELGSLRNACTLLRLHLGDKLAAAPAGWVQEYRCMLTLEGLQAMAAQCLHRLRELQGVVAEQHLELGALGLPPRTSSLCGGGRSVHWSTPLLLYSSPGELQTLAALRLRVAMLDQQLHLQKVLMAELLPLARPSGPAQVALFRALHSLLCEGGARFPTVLRDEPVDQPAGAQSRPIRSDMAGGEGRWGCAGTHSHPATPLCSPCSVSMSVLDPAPAPRGPTFHEALGELLLATGGAGGSWPSCLLPFGVLALVAGASSTAITFSLGGPRLDLAQGASLATLGTGLGLLVVALLCSSATPPAGPRLAPAAPPTLLAPCTALAAAGGGCGQPPRPRPLGPSREAADLLRPTLGGECAVGGGQRASAGGGAGSERRLSSRWAQREDSLSAALRGPGRAHDCVHPGPGSGCRLTADLLEGAPALAAG